MGLCMERSLAMLVGLSASSYGPVGKRLVGCVVAARAAVPDAAVLRARPRMSAI